MNAPVSSCASAPQGDLTGVHGLDRCRPHLLSIDAPLAPVWMALPEDAADAVLLDPPQGPARAAWGWARTQVFSGPSRLADMDAWSRKVLAEIVSETADAPPPAVLCGFAFEDEVEGVWGPFGAARAGVARFSYVRQGPRAWLQMLLDPDSDFEAQRQQLQAALRRLGASPEVRPFSAEVVNTADKQAWVSGVQRVQAAMQARGLHKVVLSRRVELRLLAPTTVRSLAAGLNQSTAAGTRFVFAFAGQAFVGVTPERLVSVKDGGVASAALAGSRPQGATQGRELLEDPKELEEHGYVADHIKQVLGALCDRLEVPRGPQLYALGYVTHLYTPVQGHLRSEVSVLGVAERLHPTPAVGGVPSRAAQDLIREVEGQARGWYTGAVGSMHANGEGELWVALRSALVSGTQGLVFVGAGLVRASDPEQEWVETRVKGQAMLGVLGVGV